MKTDKVLSVLAGLLSISAFCLYNQKILTGAAHPNITSWGLWAFMTVLNFTSYQAMSRDWLKNIVPTIGSIMCILTFIVTLYQGEWKAFERSDIFVLVIGVTASFLWWGLKSPTVANLMLQVGLSIGFIPTIRSVWYQPANEHALCWFMWTLSFVLQATVVIMRWKGKKADLVYSVNCTWLHLLVGLLALRA